MREDIQELVALREEEEKTFKIIQENYNRNMNVFEEEIDRMREECEHVYGEETTNSFFGFGVSACTLCGNPRVTG